MRARRRLLGCCNVHFVSRHVFILPGKERTSLFIIYRSVKTVKGSLVVVLRSSLKAAIFMNKSISVFRVWFFFLRGGTRLVHISFTVSNILHYLFIYLFILLVRTRSFLHSWTVFLIERLRLHLGNT